MDVTEWLGDSQYAYIPFDATEEITDQLRDLSRELDSDQLRTQAVVSIDSTSRMREGHEAEFWLDSRKIHVFDPATGDNLTRDEEAGAELTRLASEDRVEQVEEARHARPTGRRATRAPTGAGNRRVTDRVVGAAAARRGGDGRPVDPAPDGPWWRTAVVYQLYPRSFADSDGDGIGDLPGITARLSYLADLGVDAMWLSPFYPSPMADAGYDVADYRGVDPLFGTIADADRLITEAAPVRAAGARRPRPEPHLRRARLVPRGAGARPGSPERARYLFRDGRGEQGELPPNSWRSIFGGPAWTRVTEPDGSPGQWYLHLFDAKQPDLDWSNPEVREEFHDILRLWLDRGVDGFRDGRRTRAGEGRRTAGVAPRAGPPRRGR